MSPARLLSGACALTVVLGTGCGSGLATGAPSTSSELGLGPACVAFNPIVDLERALRASASFGTSSSLFFLVDSQEELGYVHVAQARLEGIQGKEAAGLREKVDRLADVLKARTEKLREAALRLKSSNEAAEAALDAAALCKGVDMRDPSRPAGEKRPVAASREAAGRDAEAAERVRKVNMTTLASKECEPTIRLWSAAGGVDLTSHVSSSAVASHITELGLDAKRGAVRDRLAVALRDHAAALHDFEALADPALSEQGPDWKQLVAARSEVAKLLDATRLACIGTMDAWDRVVGDDLPPRRVTVIVKPKWSGILEGLAGGDGSFGSGFVVRWRDAHGHVETRVVTNNHVLGEALEAEVIPGDPEILNAMRGPRRNDGGGPERTKGWTATLIQASPHEDVAILRLDADGAKYFEEGLRFRLDPAREQEQVVAAGFPGVGITPSFQVSKGTVSNAKFGAEQEDDDSTAAYVQHTAAIDPGNSGGPLLDADGRLLGMNTFKIVGRENVGLAIPTTRILLAMMRADEPVVVDIENAKASCNAIVSALWSDHPAREAMTRFGLPLLEWSERQERSARAAAYRDQVLGTPEDPLESARFRAYGALRATLENEGGVRPFELCADVRDVDGASAASPRFTATVVTRAGKHEMIFAEESGAVRLVEVR